MSYNSSYSTYSMCECMECNTRVYPDKVKTCNRCGMDLCNSCKTKHEGVCIWCFGEASDSSLWFTKIVKIMLGLSPVIALFIPAPMPLMFLIISNPAVLGYYFLYLGLFLLSFGMLLAGARRGIVKSIQNVKPPQTGDNQVVIEKKMSSSSPFSSLTPPSPLKSLPTPQPQEVVSPALPSAAPPSSIFPTSQTPRQINYHDNLAKLFERQETKEDESGGIDRLSPEPTLQHQRNLSPINVDSKPLDMEGFTPIEMDTRPSQGDQDLLRSPNSPQSVEENQDSDFLFFSSPISSPTGTENSKSPSIPFLEQNPTLEKKVRKTCPNCGNTSTISEESICPVCGYFLK